MKYDLPAVNDFNICNSNEDYSLYQDKYSWYCINSILTTVIYQLI